MAKIKVLVADDHPIILDCLCRALSQEPDMEVIGHAENGKVACALSLELKPDVVVMDVQMPLMDGVEATRKIMAELPLTRIIGCSMQDGDKWVDKMFKAGAHSCVKKDDSLEALMAAIRASTQYSTLNVGESSGRDLRLS